MFRIRPAASALSFLTMVCLASRADAIPITLDTFEDDTTMGWIVPGPTPVPPTTVPTGGPAGAGDAYLQLGATGLPGAGGRLAVLNETQWTGDFRAAGITAIAMDVNNFGPEDLTLRLLFEDFDAPGPPVNLALTLADLVIPANSGWMQVVFDLSAANLAALLGDVEGALTDVSVLRLFHNPDPAFGGPGVGIPLVNVTLGVDNITPLVDGTVPEPATGLLVLGGLAAAVLRARRRR